MKKEKGPRFKLWALIALAFCDFIYGKISITITPSSLQLNLKSGVFYNSEIQVINDGDVDYDVNIRFYDLEQNKDGEIFPVEPGTIERGCGKWFSSDLDKFKLKKGEKKIFKYYIDVPKSIKGSFAGAILFKILTEKFEQEFGAGIEVGIASKIYITISEENESLFNFKEFKVLKNEKDGYFFVLSLENTNKIFSYMSGKIFLKNENGEMVFEEKIDKGRPIFPEKEIELKYPLPMLENGNYIAVLFLNYKEDQPIIRTYAFKVVKNER